MSTIIDNVEYLQEEIPGKGLCYVPKVDKILEAIKKATYDNLIFVGRASYDFYVQKNFRGDEYLLLIKVNNTYRAFISDEGFILKSAQLMASYLKGRGVVLL